MTTRLEEGTVAFGDWETWYRVAGDPMTQVPLICLHGGPGSTHHYFARLEAMAARGRPIVVYDQVGCGGSSRPPVDELDVGIFVEELRNLRARLGLHRAFVLGTSWGGMLAIEYALTQPDGLEGLVLSSTLAHASTWAAEAARLRDALPQGHARALLTMEPGDPAYEEAERVFNLRHFCRLGETPETTAMDPVRGRDVYRAMWGPNEWTITGKLSGWDVRDRLDEITVPVLLAAGRHDMCTPRVLAQLQHGLPAAPTVIFEESSHTPYLEEPDVYIEAIGSFLDDIDPL